MKWARRLNCPEEIGHRRAAEETAEAMKPGLAMHPGVHYLVAAARGMKPPPSLQQRSPAAPGRQTDEAYHEV
jgi:hypothetical protein